MVGYENAPALIAIYTSIKMAALGERTRDHPGASRHSTKGGFAFALIPLTEGWREAPGWSLVLSPSAAIFSDVANRKK